MEWGTRTRRTVLGVLLAGMTATLLANLGGPAAGAADPYCVTPPTVSANPIKVLTIGDSLTRAAAGDYTWRYFLWRHLVTNGGTTPSPTATSFDLVGPYSALIDPVSLGTSTAYRCDFDESTGAMPGQFLAYYLDATAGGSTVVRDMVASTGADVLVVFLGANDLTRARSPEIIKSTPDQVLADDASLVTEARTANPTVKIVFLTTPAAVIPTASQSDYNAKLTTAVPTWTTEASPVALATTAQNWGTPVLTYDTIHPNPQGEITIASDVADALHSIGVGPAAVRPVPDLSSLVGPRDPAVLARPVVTGGTVSLSWTLPVGAVQSQVQRNDYTSGSGWTNLGAPITLAQTTAGPPYGSTYSDTTYVDGHVYQYRVRSAKGTTVTPGVQYPVSLTSNVATVPAGLAPTGATAVPVLHGATVSWSAALGADQYRVRWRRTSGTPLAWSGPAVATGTTRTIAGLVAGVNYDFSVASEQAGVIGTYSAPVRAVVGGYHLAAPPKPVLTLRAGHRLRATWVRKTGATRYLVQRRVGTGAWTSVGFVTTNAYTSGVLVKGKRYSFRVQPWDAYVAGGISAGSSITMK